MFRYVALFMFYPALRNVWVSPSIAGPRLPARRFLYGCLEEHQTAWRPAPPPCHRRSFIELALFVPLVAIASRIIDAGRSLQAPRQRWFALEWERSFLSL